MPSRTSRPRGGLYWRPDTSGTSGTWYIDKVILGVRLYGSCGTADRAEAEFLLARRIDAVRKAKLFGERKPRIWRDATTKYLKEHDRLRSIGDIAERLLRLDPFIGAKPLDQIDDDALTPFKAWCQSDRELVQKDGTVRKRPPMKDKSVNLHLGDVRRILRLAANKWRDEGLSWIERAPQLTFLAGDDAREPEPLSWADQGNLFSRLPRHQHDMALFKVNSGTREAEVCGLRWDWERIVPDIDARVFVVPAGAVKNKEPRLIVLNSICREIIERWRPDPDDKDACEWVFHYRGERLAHMNTSAWKRARKAAGLTSRVHDLKHTFGRRLRAAGVPLETRQVLLGHTNRDITTHYSAAEIGELIAAAEKVVERREGVLLKVVTTPKKRA